MDDMLTVLQQLGDELLVQERFIPIAHNGERLPARATEQEVKDWMAESAFIKGYDREVQLISPWRAVARG